TVHRNSRRFQLPSTAQPRQVTERRPVVTRGALLGTGCLGMRPTMPVDVGAAVDRGQLLFEDKKTPGVRYTAPVAGTVTAVNRGERRAFQSIVITLSDEERAGQGRQVAFGAWTGRPVTELSEEQVRN